MDELAGGLGRALPLRGADRDRPARLGRDRLHRHRRPALLAHLHAGPGGRARPHASPGATSCPRCRSCCAARSRRRSSSRACSGLAIAIWKFPLRAIVPADAVPRRRLHLRRDGTRGAVGDRALPAGPVRDADGVRRGRARAAGRWCRAARACGAHGRSAPRSITVAGLAYTAYRPPSLERFNNELSFRGEQGQSLHRLLETSAVERGLRCGAVSVPTHKLIPDTRWVLGLGEADVVARSDPSASSERKARYGVAIYPRGPHEHPAHRASRSTPTRSRRCRAAGSGGSRPTSTSPHTFAAPPGVPRRSRDGRPDAWALGLGGVLVGALVLRLWGIKHGLPYVFNVDEASNFVPDRGQLLLHRQLQPALLHQPARRSRTCCTRCSGSGSAAATASASALAADPTAVFVVARVTSAVLGTAAVGFVYLAAARLYDRRVGCLRGARDGRLLPAGLLLAPGAERRTRAAAAGGVGVGQRRRADARPPDRLGRGGRGARAGRRDEVHGRHRRAAAAGGRRLPADRTGTPRAEALRGARDRGRRWRCRIRDRRTRTRCCRGTSSGRTSSKQEEAASGFGKLGLDHDSGVLYYLGVLTWGFGWVPLAAALAGAVIAFRDDLRRALFLVPWPLVFIVYMGTQERFFGRWLLPALPGARDPRRPGGDAPAGRARGAAPAPAGGSRGRRRGRARRRRASTTACTSTACCRATTRATSRAPGWRPTSRRDRRSSSSRSCPTRGSRTPTRRTPPRLAAAG